MNYSRTRQIIGVTLVEILLALTLFSLLGVLLVGFFRHSMWALGRESLRLELEQSNHFLLGKLAQTLQSSSLSGISYGSRDENFVLAIHGIEDSTSDGALSWQDHLVGYFWSKDTTSLFLQRIEPEPVGLRSRALKLHKGELDLLGETIREQGVLVSEKVSRFSVENLGEGGQGRLLRLTLGQQAQLEQATRRTFVSELRIALRN